MKIKTMCMATILVVLSSVAARAGSFCVGNCGTDSANGVVTKPPIGTVYNYVSTTGGTWLGGSLPSPLATQSSATNGSTFTTAAFTATAGALLQFDFNYITSDGSVDYPDFGWAALEPTSGTPVLIFSAQTTPTGNTVPGIGLPALDSGVTLIPAASAIIPGGPVWSELGSTYSGKCYDAGCGYTGWIQEDYTIKTAGTYQLAFGVSNANDYLYDTGLAYSGIEVNGKPVGTVPEPSTLLMMGSGLLGLAGTFKRKFLS